MSKKIQSSGLSKNSKISSATKDAAQPFRNHLSDISDSMVKALASLKEHQKIALEASQGNGLTKAAYELMHTDVNHQFRMVGVRGTPNAFRGDARYLHSRVAAARSILAVLDHSIDTLEKATSSLKDKKPTTPTAPLSGSEISTMKKVQENKAVTRGYLADLRVRLKDVEDAQLGNGLTAEGFKYHSAAIAASLTSIGVNAIASGAPSKGYTIGTRLSMARTMVKYLKDAIAKLVAALGETTVTDARAFVRDNALAALNTPDVEPKPAAEYLTVYNRRKTVNVAMHADKVKMIALEQAEAVMASLPECLGTSRDLKFVRSATLRSREFLQQVIASKFGVNVTADAIYISAVESSTAFGGFSISLNVRELANRNGTNVWVVHSFTINTCGQLTTVPLIERLINSAHDKTEVVARQDAVKIMSRLGGHTAW